jgi:magnesium chelatase family protein
MSSVSCSESAVLASIPSATLLGVDGLPVRVEVHVSQGLPGFTVVGLPDAACRESRDRVRAALLSSGLGWPQKRITVNLAPSGMRKTGAGLDLAIAMGVLAATGDVPMEALEGLGFIGELGLDGRVRGVAGTVCMAPAVRAPVLVVAHSSRAEAALVDDRMVRSVGHLRDVVDALRGDAPWPETPAPDCASLDAADGLDPPPDMADIRGQAFGRYAVEIAAAGGHHLLLIGPPGAGKTMLARRVAGLLPPLTREQALETTRAHSAAGLSLPRGGLVTTPPWRAPHHGASAVGLVGGGGARLRPGEISCATGGVLFLDELAEFSTPVLESLRQPLEEGVIRVTRAAASVTFPARFLLVAAMNPCPCGTGGPPGTCKCNEVARTRYQRKLSGPLLDRFDLRLPIHRPDADQLVVDEPGEPTEVVAARVCAVRELSAHRTGSTNAAMTDGQLARFAALNPGARRLLQLRLRSGTLSARGLARIRRVARTIADLAGRDGELNEEDVATALEMRTDFDTLQRAIQ